MYLRRPVMAGPYLRAGISCFRNYKYSLPQRPISPSPVTSLYQNVVQTTVSIKPAIVAQAMIQSL